MANVRFMCSSSVVWLNFSVFSAMAVVVLSRSTSYDATSSEFASFLLNVSFVIELTNLSSQITGLFMTEILILSMFPFLHYSLKSRIESATM